MDLILYQNQNVVFKFHLQTKEVGKGNCWIFNVHPFEYFKVCWAWYYVKVYIIISSTSLCHYIPWCFCRSNKKIKDACFLLLSSKYSVIAYIPKDYWVFVVVATVWELLNESIDLRRLSQYLCGIMISYRGLTDLSDQTRPVENRTRVILSNHLVTQALGQERWSTLCHHTCVDKSIERSVSVSHTNSWMYLVSYMKVASSVVMRVTPILVY